MATKTFKQLLDASKKRDEFWVEKAKLEFAEELSKIMDRRDINKTKLAARFGSTPAYITKALRGDVNFTIETMVKFVRALNGKMHFHIAGEEDGCRWVDIINGVRNVKRPPLPKGNFRQIGRPVTVRVGQLLTGKNDAQGSAAA